MNNKIKHLEFIQNIITRMNSNSFLLKGSTITIVSALIAIYASTNNTYFILIGVFPVLIFWFLDTYYLQQERKFRGLYDDVAGITKYFPIKVFGMSIENYKNGKYSYYHVFISKTLLFFYPLIVLMLTIIVLILHFANCSIIKN